MTLLCTTKKFLSLVFPTSSSNVCCKALPTGIGIPVSDPPPTSVITPYAISATQLLRMRSMMDSL